jgi:hypothetical protein
MRRQYLTILSFLIVLILILPITYSSNINQTQNNDTQTSLLNGAKITVKNDITIVFLNGSYYQMGYQQGVLLEEQIKQNLRAFINYSKTPISLLIETWDIMKDYVPDEYIDEIQGIADGAGLSFEDVIAGYMVIVRETMACFGISAWGDATEKGNLIHVRSFDQPLEIIDPVTGIPAYENNVLIVRKPENGFASISPTIAGTPHSGGGINSMGIALGQQVCWSKDQTLKGTPALFKSLMVLDNAENIDDALNILTSNNTLGWNFIVSDAKIPIGYAVETTANHTYIGTWDDAVESKRPFWQIKDVVRRTNFFLEPNIALTQRNRVNPGGLINFLKLVRRTDVFFAVWRSYRAISRDIDKNWGTLTLNSAMSMIRNGYAGRTDILLRLIVILAEGTSFNRAWNIWAADPISGDILVCFAKNGKIAFENPVHHFNMFELFDT